MLQANLRHLQSAHWSSASRCPAFLRGTHRSSPAASKLCSLSRAPLALQPHCLAIDCAFEQLDASVRDSIVTWMLAHKKDFREMWLADNRFDEWAQRPSSMEAPPLAYATQDALHYELNPRLVDEDTALGREPPGDICLEGITLGYGRARCVLEDINLRLVPGRIYYLTGGNGGRKDDICSLSLRGHLPPQRPDKGEGAKDLALASSRTTRWLSLPKSPCPDLLCHGAG